MKKVLILGGTLFLGRVIIEQLLETTDYSITIFNRGRTNPALFPECKKIIGDRYNIHDFKKITENYYDCVIDTSGYFPEFMQQELELLKGKVGRYIFISTISVYDHRKVGDIISEEDPILPYNEKDRDNNAFVLFGNLRKPIPKLYGKKKAECERLLLNCDWLDTIIFRPAIIYGKYDFCDRYYYWLYRVKTQDKILVPQYGNHVQNNTHVEDFANIIRQAIDIDTHENIYNVVTHDPVSLSKVLKSMQKVLKTKPTYLGASSFFLFRNFIRKYRDIPSLWDGKDVIVDNSKLKSHFNCLFLSFEDSIKSTVDFYNRSDWQPAKDGMSIERERKLLLKLEKKGAIHFLQKHFFRSKKNKV